jgi:hypothetical protein
METQAKKIVVTITVGFQCAAITLLRVQKNVMKRATLNVPVHARFQPVAMQLFSLESNVIAEQAILILKKMLVGHPVNVLFAEMV